MLEQNKKYQVATKSLVWEIFASAFFLAWYFYTSSMAFVIGGMLALSCMWLFGYYLWYREHGKPLEVFPVGQRLKDLRGKYGSIIRYSMFGVILLGYYYSYKTGKIWSFDILSSSQGSWVQFFYLVFLVISAMLVIANIFFLIFDLLTLVGVKPYEQWRVHSRIAAFGLLLLSIIAPYALWLSFMIIYAYLGGFE